MVLQNSAKNFLQNGMSKRRIFLSYTEIYFFETIKHRLILPGQGGERLESEYDEYCMDHCHGSGFLLSIDPASAKTTERTPVYDGFSERW